VTPRVEPAGVVVGEADLQGPFRPQPAGLDLLGEQVGDVQHLDVEVSEQPWVLLHEGDVVVGVEGDDPPGARLAPVLQVVAGELLVDVDVAHLERRAAAAPLVVHQPELDPCLAQQQADRLRHLGLAVGGHAVAEQDRVAAPRQVEVVGPVRHLGRISLHLVAVGDGVVVPLLPGATLDPSLDAGGPYRLDQLHQLGPVAVEVAGEQGVGAAQLTGAALGAIGVLLVGVLQLDQAAGHGGHGGMEAVAGVLLVAGHLVDGARLAAELVA
jgi:hypothetical protein